MSSDKIWMQINSILESREQNNDKEGDPIYDTLFSVQKDPFRSNLYNFDNMKNEKKAGDTHSEIIREKNAVPTRSLSIVKGLAKPAGAEDSNCFKSNPEEDIYSVIQNRTIQSKNTENLAKPVSMQVSSENTHNTSNSKRTNEVCNESDPMEALLPNIYQQSVRDIKDNNNVYKSNTSRNDGEPEEFYFNEDKLKKFDMDCSDAVEGWDVPPSLDGAPPVYSLRDNCSRKSLKQNQIDSLQKEKEHPGGVKVILRKGDCHHTISFVDINDKIWIAGWNQAARPFLHSAFHVGDQVISINQHYVENSLKAYKLIKYTGSDENVVFIIKRAPFARIFLFRREHDGQDLGIRRKENTGEIIGFKPFSIAHKQGMPSKSPSLDGTNLCNWYLTEINNRPVSLFFKKSEIDHRLNAVGLDISIMVQPSEFVNQLKKGIKLIKNYKDFIPK